MTEVISKDEALRALEKGFQQEDMFALIQTGLMPITADEGDGPVNALDLALRKALSRFYPVLENMRLTDFKVRVVSASGTASAVRVRIDSTDGKNVFSTVGVSTNILEASFIALTDSIDCLLMHHAQVEA